MFIVYYVKFYIKIISGCNSKILIQEDSVANGKPGYPILQTDLGDLLALQRNAGDQATIGGDETDDRLLHSVAVDIAVGVDIDQRHSGIGSDGVAFAMTEFVERILGHEQHDHSLGLRPGLKADRTGGSRVVAFGTVTDAQHAFAVLSFDYETCLQHCRENQHALGARNQFA